MTMNNVSVEDMLTQGNFWGEFIPYTQKKNCYKTWFGKIWKKTTIKPQKPLSIYCMTKTLDVQSWQALPNTIYWLDFCKTQWETQKVTNNNDLWLRFTKYGDRRFQKDSSNILILSKVLCFSLRSLNVGFTTFWTIMWDNYMWLHELHWLYV